MNTDVQSQHDTRQKQPSTAVADWDDYAESFLSVMPSKMLILNKEVASHTRGHVADFGCGAGKLIPFVMTRLCVKSYIGIDASSDMIRLAGQVARHFGDQRASTLHSTIEDTRLSNVDTAVSINSYYVWPDSDSILAHIREQLHPESCFILATINPAIDMAGLLEEAEMELFAHPHWTKFKQHNLQINNNRHARFIGLDPLIEQVRRIGFVVEDAHTRLYDGGLNFLRLGVGDNADFDPGNTRA